MVDILDLPAGAYPKQGYIPIPAPRLGTSQNVSYNASGGASTQSSAFGASTQMIQVSVASSSTAAGVRVETATNPTSSSTSPHLPNGTLIYLRVYPGEKISVLSNDSNTGSINVVECGSIAG